MAPGDVTSPALGGTLDERPVPGEDYGGTGLYRDHTPPAR
jgi:hypothetical protein